MKAMNTILRWMRRTWTRLLVSYYTEMAFSDKIIIGEDVTISVDYRDPAFELKLRHEGYTLPEEPVCRHQPEQRHHMTWLMKTMMCFFCFQHTIKISAGGKELLIGHGRKSLLLSSFDGTSHYSDDNSWLRKLFYKVTLEEQTEELFQDVVWGTREEDIETIETEVIDNPEEIVVEPDEPNEDSAMDIDFSLFR